jgi:hypothetical protein
MTTIMKTTPQQELKDKKRRQVGSRRLFNMTIHVLISMLLLLLVLQPSLVMSSSVRRLRHSIRPFYKIILNDDEDDHSSNVQQHSYDDDDASDDNSSTGDAMEMVILEERELLQHLLVERGGSRRGTEVLDASMVFIHDTDAVAAVGPTLAPTQRANMMVVSSTNSTATSTTDNGSGGGGGGQQQQDGNAVNDNGEVYHTRNPDELDTVDISDNNNNNEVVMSELSPNPANTAPETTTTTTSDTTVGDKETVTTTGTANGQGGESSNGPGEPGSSPANTVVEPSVPNPSPIDVSTGGGSDSTVAVEPNVPGDDSATTVQDGEDTSSSNNMEPIGSENGGDQEYDATSATSVPTIDEAMSPGGDPSEVNGSDQSTTDESSSNNNQSVGDIPYAAESTPSASPSAVGGNILAPTTTTYMPVVAPSVNTVPTANEEPTTTSTVVDLTEFYSSGIPTVGDDNGQNAPSTPTVVAEPTATTPSAGSDNTVPTVPTDGGLIEPTTPIDEPINVTTSDRNNIPDVQTATLEPPTSHPTADVAIINSQRHQDVLRKCGVGERARLTMLSNTVGRLSQVSVLTDEATPQYQAFTWLDQFDSRLVCPQDEQAVKQRYISALLYFALGGGGWKSCGATASENGCPQDSRRWLTGEHECEWFGLSCESSGNYSSTTTTITKIVLPNNNLAGELPRELFSLTDLKGLSMGHNKNISGSIPEEVSALTKLEYIDLDDNALSGPFPAALYGLTSLQAIDLNNNQISGSISNVIGDLVNLVVLQMENNLLTGGTFFP